MKTSTIVAGIALVVIVTAVAEHRTHTTAPAPAPVTAHSTVSTPAPAEALTPGVVDGSVSGPDGTYTATCSQGHAATVHPDTAAYRHDADGLCAWAQAEWQQLENVAQQDGGH